MQAYRYLNFKFEVRYVFVTSALRCLVNPLPPSQIPIIQFSWQSVSLIFLSNFIRTDFFFFFDNNTYLFIKRVVTDVVVRPTGRKQDVGSNSRRLRFFLIIVSHQTHNNSYFKVGQQRLPMEIIPRDGSRYQYYLF